FAGWLGFDVPGEIIDDEQIEATVVVDVDPGAAYRPKRAVLGIGARDATLRGHIGECPVAAVVVEADAVDAAHEEVLVAVIVVIPNGDAVVESFAGEPGLGGDVLEAALPVAFEEAVRILGRSLL